MDLEERLERIDRFNLANQKAEASSDSSNRLVQILNGSNARNQFGGFLLVKKSFDQTKLSREIGLTSSSKIRGEMLSQLCSPKKSTSSKVEQIPFDLSKAVFLDCETTGLAGGAGTYAFLVGLGYLSGNEFMVEQYFMQDFHQERAILAAMLKRLNGFKFLVSFNGKCYDLPLLENRFVINRLDFDSSNWEHLDLLFPCRRLWKRRIGECNLGNIEQKILGVVREMDVPSYLVPQIYFDYLRDGEAEPLVPVFHHNVYDILSLLGLSILIDQALEDFSLSRIVDPKDLYSLGRIHQNLGNYQASLGCFKQALFGELSPEWELEIYTSLASVHKKTGQLEEAAGIWEGLLQKDHPFSFSVHEELAKYYEHKKKDYTKALSVVERAISQLNADPTVDFAPVQRRRFDSLEYRKARLDRKRSKSANK
jgi:uncharacterized protein YprB with RNaseH-like and TPR domain